MYTYPPNRPFQRRHTEPNIFTYYNRAHTTNPHYKDEDIAHIDGEIARVEDGIVMLVRRRALLKRKRNTYSPAVNLPPELLALIFEYACLPTSDDADELFISHQDGMHGTMNLGMGMGAGAVTPLFIGTVCSAWRDLAFGTSRLWNAVIILLNEKHAGEQARLVQQWLTRAGNRPLSIRVVEEASHGWWSENEDDDDDDRSVDAGGIDVTSTAVIDVLTSFSSQWRKVDLFVPPTWKGPLAQIRHALPLLTTLTLRVAEDSPRLARIDAFAHAPNLRRVSLVRYYPHEVVLPWTQLERLDGEYFTVRECLDALRRCPSLRRCQFHQVDWLYEDSANPVPLAVQHEHLEALELVIGEEPEMALLGVLRLPALKELVLSLSDRGPLLRAAMPFLRRSTCARTMTHLHLVGDTPGDEELVKCLREMDALEVLLLINPVTDSEESEQLGDRFLEAMDPRRGGRIQNGGVHDERDSISDAYLVPRLLRFEYQGAVAFSTHTLVEFLVRRWNPQLANEAYNGRHFSTYFKPPNSQVAMDVDSEPEGLPIHVARLQSVVLTTARKIPFDSDDAEIVHSLIEDGMHLEFVKDVNADGLSW